MIGYFGLTIFETSDQRILNFSGFKRESSARFGTHEPIGAKPRQEFIAPGLQTVSFTINLNANFGVKPREQMDEWAARVESGEPEVLVIGWMPIGDDLWVVKSVSESWDNIWSGGELFSGKIDVTLEEYISEI